MLNTISLIKQSLFTLSIVSFLSCDYSDDRLKIINSSKKNIVVETYLDTIPDITKTNDTEYYLDHVIREAEKNRLIKVGSINGWPFQIINSKNNKLNLFVFVVDSIEKYHTIDSLIKRKIYTRYEFSQKELENTNWTIILK